MSPAHSRKYAASVGRALHSVGPPKTLQSIPACSLMSAPTPTSMSCCCPGVSCAKVINQLRGSAGFAPGVQPAHLQQLETCRNVSPGEFLGAPRLSRHSLQLTRLRARNGDRGQDQDQHGQHGRVHGRIPSFIAQNNSDLRDTEGPRESKRVPALLSLPGGW